MNIKKTGATPSPSAVHAARAATGGARPEKPVPPVRRADSVRISEPGRSLAGGATPLEREPAAPLTPEHVAQLRERIAAGMYDSEEVIARLTCRILASGELDAPGHGPGADG